MCGTPFLAACYLRVIHVRTCSCYVFDYMVSRTSMSAKPGLSRLKLLKYRTLDWPVSVVIDAC